MLDEATENEAHWSFRAIASPAALAVNNRIRAASTLAGLDHRVLATQAPKGLHNQISGNATTQFFGLLNAPAQIDAARDLAAKGGKLPDIGLLNSGQFYVAGEGFSFIKVSTPLCLTHHPKAPLSPEAVIRRASRYESVHR